MNLSEAQTRQDIIDGKLLDAGWNVNDPTKVSSEYFIPGQVKEKSAAYNTFEKSDYVLLGQNGKPVAVVEAKKSTKDAELGREQAKQYCYNISQQENVPLPFCFYTNGHDIFFWDLENAPPRKVIGFPTLDDIERYQFIRNNKKKLTHELINADIAGRDYQIKAIRSVLEGIDKNERDFLLVMATGTGKTRTCIALVDALMRANRVEKVLFLVDRIALREQALDAFKEHLPDEPRWPHVGEKLISKSRRIYVSTYPTMLNIITTQKNTLSPHFFDLVVIDESHRSIYNTYKEVLDYFKAINVGLTATPVNLVDRSTFSLFECKDGVPSFAYTYEQAVNNIPPYLSDFRVMKIQTKFQIEGISKRTVSLEEQKQLILDGKEIEDISFEGKDLEKIVTNAGTNTLIVKEFMEECIKDSNGVIPGKTIFFCSSIDHARRLEQTFDTLYPEYCGNLAKVIVSDDPRVYGKSGLLAQFTNKDMPRIAISVDMLDTGIDVRELVNLVFAKPVYSYTKFWQMIGRGTRLLEPKKIKPWCTKKDDFLIIDCWDNFEYFKVEPKGKESNSTLALPIRYIAARINKIAKAIELNQVNIIQKESQTLRHNIAELPSDSIAIREASANLEKIESDEYWQVITNDKIEFLRNEIQPLFKTLSNTDFKAMRFNKDILELSTVLMGKNADIKQDAEKYHVLLEGVIEQIKLLPLSIDFVAEHKELIEQSQRSKYWQICTDVTLDVLMVKLSPLMKHKDNSNEASQTVHLNFKDEVRTKEMVEFGPENESIHIDQYKEMVEKLITELTDSNPVLQKIQANQIISEVEAEQLADFLHNEHPHITEDLLRRVYKNRKAKFVQFIRHILGLETLSSFPETVSKAFEQFIAEHTSLTTRQLEFLSLLKSFVIDQQKVEKRDLIQAPFTVIHPQGIRGIFDKEVIKEILVLTEKLAA
jgi:type I restriction enzyme R subunit